MKNIFTIKPVISFALSFTSVLAMGIVLNAPHAHAEGDVPQDVFADEGDADFNDIPSDVSALPKKPGQITKVAPKANVEMPPPNVQPVMPPKVVVTTQAPAPQPVPEVVAPKEQTSFEPAPTTEELTGASAEPMAKPMRQRVSKHVMHTGPQDKDISEYGFKTVQRDCPMRREPASSGDTMLTVKKNKRVWIQIQDKSWVKGYSQAGPGYMNTDECF